MTHPALQALLAAKAESDRGNWVQKHLLMRRLITGAPGDFVVDSDRGDGILGITHSPTKFRTHLPAHVLPVQLQKAAPAAEEESVTTKVAAAEALLTLTGARRPIDAAYELVKLAGPVGSVVKRVAGRLGAPKVTSTNPMQSAARQLFNPGPARATHVPVPPPPKPPVPRPAVGSASQVAGTFAQLPGATLEAAKGLGRGTVAATKGTINWGRQAARNLGNDAQGGFSAADTALRKARVNPATTGRLGRAWGHGVNAVTSPYVNPMNAPRAVGVGLEKALGAAGSRVGGATGAVLSGTGQAAGLAGRGAANVLNLAQAGPSSLVTGTGRAANLARSGLYYGSYAPAVAGGAYVTDQKLRENGQLGLFGRRGRALARDVASVPTSPAALAGVNIPGKGGTAVIAAKGGDGIENVGANPTDVVNRTMPDQVANMDGPDIMDWVSNKVTGAPMPEAPVPAGPGVL